jgi:hypothetical protein
MLYQRVGIFVWSRKYIPFSILFSFLSHIRIDSVKNS